MSFYILKKVDSQQGFEYTATQKIKELYVSQDIADVQYKMSEYLHKYFQKYNDYDYTDSQEITKIIADYSYMKTILIVRHHGAPVTVRTITLVIDMIC